jgi:uncharacterized protein YjiS (DUF1127 family)
MSILFGYIVNYMLTRRRQQHAIKELSRLSDKDLKELGIPRSHIKVVAKNAMR